MDKTSQDIPKRFMKSGARMDRPALRRFFGNHPSIANLCFKLGQGHTRLSVGVKGDATEAKKQIPQLEYPWVEVHPVSTGRFVLQSL
jgi:hypothetical protein